MDSGDLAFVLLAINPIGGLLVAIPLALLRLNYPLWLAVAGGVPLAYVQVVVVDFGWDVLCRWGWWNRLLERQRSPRIERLMASRGAFWPITVVTPLVGPWVVMAFMGYARVPQRHVAAPILLALTVVAIAVGALCLWVPGWMAQPPSLPS